MKDWMAAPAFATTKLIMSPFVLACQGCIKTYPNTRPPEHSHKHPNTNSDTCLCISSWVLTQVHKYTLGEHTQPIKRALFSHLMILKMLVFHWLKHSKQTWRGDTINKQAQSVFSAVNAAHLGMCNCVCVWLSGCVMMTMQFSFCWTVGIFVYSLRCCFQYVGLCLRSWIFSLFIEIYCMCVCLRRVCVCICLGLCAQWRN